MAAEKYFAIVYPDDRRPEIIRGFWHDIQPKAQGKRNVLYRGFGEYQKAMAWAEQADQDLKVKIKRDERRAKIRKENRKRAPVKEWAMGNLDSLNWNRKFRHLKN